MPSIISRRGWYTRDPWDEPEPQRMCEVCGAKDWPNEDYIRCAMCTEYTCPKCHTDGLCEECDARANETA